MWRATIDRVAVCVAASDSTTGVITEQHIRRALRLFSWAGRIQGRKSTKGAGTSIDGAVKPVAAHSQWGLRNRPRSRPPPVDARGASQPATVHTLPTTARAENAHTATRPTTRAKEKKTRNPNKGDCKSWIVGADGAIGGCRCDRRRPFGTDKPQRRWLSERRCGLGKTGPPKAFSRLLEAKSGAGGDRQRFSTLMSTPHYAAKTRIVQPDAPPCRPARKISSRR